MHEHTTHFNDCGCLTARKDAEIAALLARVSELEEKLRLANIDAANETARANDATAERDRLREALERIQTMTVLEWQGTARGCYIIAGKALEPR